MLIRPKEVPKGQKSSKERHQEKSQRQKGWISRGNDSTFRVLIVDDDYYSIVPLKKIFEDLGCEVVVAEGGIEAMEKLKRDPLDLLILDWVMPDMAGNETLEKIQRYLDEGRWSGVTAFAEDLLPVVSFSALPQHTMLFPEVHSMTYIDHWRKPMPYNELGRRAKNVIEMIRQDEVTI